MTKSPSMNFFEQAVEPAPQLMPDPEIAPEPEPEIYAFNVYNGADVSVTLTLSMITAPEPVRPALENQI